MAAGLSPRRHGGLHPGARRLQRRELGLQRRGRREHDQGAGRQLRREPQADTGRSGSLPRQESRHHRRRGDAPPGRRGRQRRQDTALHGRDDRGLLLQLRLAVPGPQPPTEPDPADRRALGQPARGHLQAHGVGGERALRRADHRLDRRRHPLQPEGVREARSAGAKRPGPSSWPTTPRSRRPASIR
jgi:hypothetical protein